jgi:ferritin-like metal-binding protein YciE
MKNAIATGKEEEAIKTATAIAVQRSSFKSNSKDSLKESIEREHNVEGKSDPAEKLRELFVDSMKDIYWAEKVLIKAIPVMAINTTAPKLVEGLSQHLVETEGQITRLEKVFTLLLEKAVTKKCDAMDPLIEEVKSIAKETEIGAVRDAGIVAAAQKIEHYEITTYGTPIS